MKRLLTLGMSALALATPAMAQDVTITNAKVVIGDGSAPIEGGTVACHAIEEGRLPIEDRTYALNT